MISPISIIYSSADNIAFAIPLKMPSRLLLLTIPEKTWLAAIFEDTLYLMYFVVFICVKIVGAKPGIALLDIIPKLTGSSRSPADKVYTR